MEKSNGGFAKAETMALIQPTSTLWSTLPTLSSTTEVERNGPKPKAKSRSINFLSLAFIAYFAVAAGPFGIEVAVQAAGAFPVLIAVIILPFTWGLPQALMTAELSTMMNENGGYILWVRRGLGEYAGWINAFNSIASNLLDLPTYPVLFASYVEAYLNSQDVFINDMEKWGLKACALLLVFLANVFGMRIVAFSSIAMSLFVLAPFLLEPIALTDFHTSAWYLVAPSIDWSLFLSTIVWNYQGWDSLGCIAGEVSNGGKSYPAAISLALLLITFNYAFPVAIGVMVDSDLSQWKEGMLVTVATKIAGWCGIWVGLAAVVATLGEFNVVMACSSRALWATANYRMVPTILTKEWGRHPVPIAAICFQTLTTAFLMSFSFSSLVVLDSFFNNLTLLLEFSSYLRLKYTEPNTKRPFEVPGGMAGAWIVTLPKLLVISGVLLAQGSHVWTLALVFNAGLTLVYVIWSRFYHSFQLFTRP